MPKEQQPTSSPKTARTTAPVKAPPTRAAPAGAETLIQRAMADPASLSVQEVAQLQRQMGNQAVRGLLSRSATAPSAPAPVAAVQRAPIDTATEEEIAPAAEAPAAESAGGGMADSARPAAPPDDENLQRQAALGGPVGLAGGPVEAGIEDRLQRARSGGQALPAPVRTRMESAFHTDFSSVKVHADLDAHNLNRDLGARAFTSGRDLFFKDGEYQPHASSGQKLLAHELTHVVQQGGAVRRKPNFIGGQTTKAIQRVTASEAVGRDEWKGMSTWGKAAMVPGGALYGAAQGARAGYGGAYNMLSGGQTLTGWRKALAGVGAGVLGTLALPFMLAGGAVRGAAQGIANPLASVGKRIGGGAASLPDRARRAVGNYGGDLTRQQNATGSTDADLVGNAASVVASGATGARTGLDIASRAGSGNFMGHDIVGGSGISGASTAFGALGAGAAGLGAISAAIEAGQGASIATDSSQATSTRVLGGGQALSGLGDATRQGATATYNVASMISAQGAVAAAATLVAGGASIVMGAIDMLRGGYGMMTAEKRREALEAIADAAQRSPDMLLAEKNMIVTTARAAARQAVINRGASGATIAKGAVAIAGGIVLIATAATPIGWALLAGAAIIGGISALVRLVRRRLARRAIVKESLPDDVKAARVTWKRDKLKIEEETWAGTLERRRRMRAIGPDPLDKWLADNGFRSVDHAYAKYINDTAQTIYTNAVENDHPQMKSLLEGLGLRIDKEKKEPKPAKIAKAIAQ